MSTPRCSKCQGFGHTSSVCPNKEFITLAEWEAAMEEENEEEHEHESDHELEETQVKVVEEAREEVLRRVASQPKGVKVELASPLPTHPLAQTLTQNFCPFILEPLPKAPNFELRAYEEVVQSMFKEPPLYNTQISKGNARTRVSKIKRDLFAWLILFQPELKQAPSQVSHASSIRFEDESPSTTGV